MNRYSGTDTTTNDRHTAHRPRQNRLARGPGQDRPAACRHGDTTPEQTGMEDPRRNIMNTPVQTGWSETLYERATLTLGYQLCTEPECYPHTDG